MKYDIVLGGVGGQGILLASQVIAQAAMNRGLKVMMAETHGMAQRGGSVISHVRLGDIYGALVPEGHADLVVGFEYMEAFRQLKFLAKGKKLIINAHRIKPVTLETYPELDFDLGDYDVLRLDASRIALNLGNPIVTNMVIVGAMSQFAQLPASQQEIKDAIRESVPSQFAEIDLKAFEEGVRAAQ
ncbi:MAG: indolepyruvate oxidoreductase subunit beta [Theionarchaea archaeon]|nr:indolepyruvate oxidoreductase subunit beta [Theionarchaea archaeon]MBU7001530.1 indolepyruvate oxidoreductase subunit beta [Theionarchaea archaeon]MBU7021389.1 indolepyruvate oxidoreductase subunit beta [Theionarchaea archaeon]MBU7041031.1 indolepyruvate oxidoreductase subunit beta [Theionarchaea archaeon]